MMERFIGWSVLLIVLGPGKNTPLCQGVDLGQQSRGGLDPGGPASLVTPILIGPTTHLSPLLVAHAVKPLLALLTTSQNPTGVELSGHATAIGFAAFSPKQVERTRNHGLGTQEPMHNGSHRGVGSVDLLAQFGWFYAQSVLSICIIIQIAKKKMTAKSKIHQKNWPSPKGPLRPPPFHFLPSV
jgi:hypothetical protein